MSDRMEYGQVCRARCKAPARYLANGKCLFLSAMDNSLNVDVALPATGDEDSFPLPTDDALRRYRPSVME